jgi:ketosteroid isomerase-like protein
VSDIAAVAAVLDEFHSAAAAADAGRYLATLTDDMVFLGTAPGERWIGAEWRDFVSSYFSRGKGWAYTPSGRSVAVAPDGDTAWFDETVENEHFGACRGSGVLRKEGDAWRVAQYNLTIPVPDELVPELVSRIREVRPA